MLHAEIDQFLYTLVWRGGRADREFRYPDAVTDTDLRRFLQAKRRLPMLRRLRREAIRRGSRGQLVMLTVTGLPGTLYERKAHREARQLAKALCDPWPHWCRLERGQRGGFHLHVLAPAEVQTAPEIHREPVYDLFGVLEYLAKPVDARAAKLRNRPLRLPAVCVAAEEYLSARQTAYESGFMRLPVASWTGFMPRRRKVAAALDLAVLRLVLGHLSAEARRAAYIRHALASLSSAVLRLLSGMSAAALAMCRAALTGATRTASRAPHGPEHLTVPRRPLNARPERAKTYPARAPPRKSARSRLPTGTVAHPRTAEHVSSAAERTYTE